MSSGQPTGTRRRTLQWPVLLWLTVVWTLLWGDLSVFNVLSGLVVAIVVCQVFPLPFVQ